MNGNRLWWLAAYLLGSFCDSRVIVEYRSGIYYEVYFNNHPILEINGFFTNHCALLASWYFVYFTVSFSVEILVLPNVEDLFLFRKALKKDQLVYEGPPLDDTQVLWNATVLSFPESCHYILQYRYCYCIINHHHIIIMPNR